MTRASDTARLIGAGATINDGTTITTADNTAQLTLQSTDADSGIGPHQVFYRNSASPADADLLCELDFRGRNDNSQDVDYAVINVKANDVTDGEEDGEFILQVATAGSVDTTMHIKPDEIVFNEDRINRDFRVESANQGNTLVVDAGLDTVLMGTSSEYSGTNAALTVNKAIDVGDSGSSDNGTIAFVKNASTGTIGSLQSKITGFSTMPKINFTATNVGGGSQTGDLEFYTTLNASQALRFQIKGNADLLADDTSIGSLSDERLKKDIEDFTYDLDKFKALQTKSFKWKNTIIRKTGTQYGTIAQQIESVDPDFIIEDELKPTITTNGEENTNTDYTLIKDTDGVAKASKITGKKDAMFISVIQQLIAKVETLEAEVAKLKG